MKNMMWNFLDSDSSSMMELMTINDMMMNMIYMIMISMTMLMLILKTKKMNMINYENNKTELMWTTAPLVIIMSMISPSVMSLYSMEESQKSLNNIKVNASQWFWSFEYPQFHKIQTDSYMKKNKKSKIRCLMSSNPMIIPTKVPSNILISSNDVIHSFSINSMGIKMDAVPGRINMTTMESKKSGKMTGQCSEICGMNHSFMPININSISTKMI